MLKRLEVHNYRSLADTVFEPRSLCLLVGLNGSGKTTLFELLDGMRRLVVDGANVGSLFSPSTLTRWRTDTTQKVVLQLEDGGDVFEYVLIVEHVPDQGKVRIGEERLALGGKPLFLAEKGRARLFRDDHSEGPPLIMDWSRSGIAALEPKPDNKKLVRFRELVAGFLLARITPGAMLGRADGEVPHPLPDLSDFASWYRHLSQEHAERMRDLFDDLRQVVPGFQKLKLVQFPDNVRDLRVELDAGSGKQDYRFAELSDGQRALIGLYTIMHCAVNAHSLVMLDEPDNFVALAELQPWLVGFADKVNAAGGQAVVASHHPEIIDYLAGSGTTMVKRDADGTTKVFPWHIDVSNGLKASEALARGWLDA
ncbi:MAG: AAA family ATPase [Planctomycetes bacterium]|nr:AAA family ATPase [Planctomycetota bacterium]